MIMGHPGRINCSGKNPMPVTILMPEESGFLTAY
jgi:hypothetical protein